MKTRYAVIIAIAIFFIACKKGGQSIFPSKNADVYIAGSVKAQNGNYVAAYWKNGVITKLTDSLSDAFANNIAVNGTDVYVTGSVDNKGATYWKNGSPVVLSPFGKTFAITAVGNDVYVAGQSIGLCYWKNGVATKIPGSILLNDLNSIAVKGNDVYVVGSSIIKGSVATYWKNGVPKRLVDSTLFSYAKGIIIQGNDVYISGYTSLSPDGFEVATYWKNEIRHTISPDHYSEAISIAVSGSDIYLAGNTNVRANGNSTLAYWKNGIETRLGSEGLGYYASSVQVVGKDVYVSGFAGNAKVYWKNNVAVPFSNDLSARGEVMVVVPR